MRQNGAEGYEKLEVGAKNSKNDCSKYVLSRTILLAVALHLKISSHFTGNY